VEKTLKALIRANRFIQDKSNQPAVKAALGQQGSVEGEDYRGVPVLAVVRAVPDSPWFMVKARL